LFAKRPRAIFAKSESSNRTAGAGAFPQPALRGKEFPSEMRAGQRREKWGKDRMAEIKAPVERPLSPHLFIYKPMLTMLMSIAHRVTGAGLYFGTLLLAWWLLAAASGPNAYAGIGSFMSSLVGRVILFGYTWTLIHHMLGGIRHLIWDTGHGFGSVEREWLAIATLVGSISLTVVIWVLGYLFAGGWR
jgi:succinate dehydrogenase / fumarate reductase cytochrome b subunit